LLIHRFVQFFEQVFLKTDFCFDIFQAFFSHGGVL
jgi:hypothetical protein